jgi:hypothetical protein
VLGAGAEAKGLDATRRDESAGDRSARAPGERRRRAAAAMAMGWAPSLSLSPFLLGGGWGWGAWRGGLQRGARAGIYTALGDGLMTCGVRDGGYRVGGVPVAGGPRTVGLGFCG